MPKPTKPTVREPVQAYLAPDESALLSELARAVGLSKAEVIRRGIRAFARELGSPSPVLAFIESQPAGAWPPADATRHDDLLADEYAG